MTIGLLLTSLTLGIRHGVDWDHIAAIADLSSSAGSRRKGFLLSFIYASGHAAVVLALGAIAIMFGTRIPTGADAWMGRIVGLTLVAMGLWIMYDLARSRRGFRLRSRWILILNGAYRGVRRVRGASQRRRVVLEHDHNHQHEDGHAKSPEHDHAQAHDHSHLLQTADVAVPASTGVRRLLAFTRREHRHPHRHELALGNDPTAHAGNGTAAGIGVLHGIGFESPTQIAVFVASTSVVGATAGLTLLLAWVVGLLVANAALAALAGFGLLHAERNFAIYATIAVAVAVASLLMGALLLTGFDVLPAILT